MDATLFWSRIPGKFVNKLTGEGTEVPGLKFTGKVSEWYDTLIETTIDCINHLQKATFAKNGGAKRVNINVYASPDVCCIFQSSILLTPVGKDVEALDLASHPIGKIADFIIHEDKILSRDQVRVVATFKVSYGSEVTMFGNVKVLDIPELR